jgi:hypothetical protein
MLRCQTCGSREAKWEWCSRCGNPNPFSWFKKFRAIAVLLVLGGALFLALLAYQHTQSLDLSVQEFRGGPWSNAGSFRRAGI